MLAWYQWAMLPAAAMRPTCVVPMQYFLCDRKAVALTVDDTIPATSLQTSTIVLSIHMPCERACQRPQIVWQALRVHEDTAQFGYGDQLPFW